MYIFLPDFKIDLSVVPSFIEELTTIQAWQSPFAGSQEYLPSEKPMSYLGAYVIEYPEIAQKYFGNIEPKPYKICVTKIEKQTFSPIHFDVNRGNAVDAAILTVLNGYVEMAWYEGKKEQQRVKLIKDLPTLVKVGIPHRGFNSTDEDVLLLSFHFNNTFDELMKQLR